MPASRIMYIENKSAQPPGQRGLQGPTRIGRVTFSKSGRSLYYKGKAFQSLKGRGFKANCFDVETHGEYWISGPKALTSCTGLAPRRSTTTCARSTERVIRRQPSKKNQKTT